VKAIMYILVNMHAGPIWESFGSYLGGTRNRLPVQVVSACSSYSGGYRVKALMLEPERWWSIPEQGEASGNAGGSS